VRTVRVTDETGATKERSVAKSSYRKRLAVFYFAATPADTAVAWLRAGAPSALATDLGQDLFLDVRQTAHFRKALRDAGAGTGYNVPPALKRKIADDADLPYFIAGSVASRGDSVQITVNVHRSGNGERVGTHTATGSDFLALIDELSVEVKKDLGVPEVRPDSVKDLAVEELLSSSPEAVRAMIAGQTAAWDDKYADAERGFARATELDPTFALAHFALYQTRALQGNAQAALPSLQAAMQYSYRLPERLAMLAKVEHFVSSRDMDKAYSVASMMTEVYPDDLDGYRIRAQLEGFRDDKPAMITTLRRILELDPQQQELQLSIGQLQEGTGQNAEAVKTYEAYGAKFPQRVAAQLLLAKTQQRLGQLTEARATLDRALLHEPTNSEVLTELALLLRNQGELDASWQQLQAARAAAHTAEDRARVLQGIQAYHSFRGEMRQSLAAAQERLAVVAEHQPPVYVVSQQMTMLREYVRAGQPAQAQASLEQVKLQMKGALGEFWRLGQLVMAIETRDTVQLNEGLRGVRSIIDGFGFKIQEPTYARGQAVLFEQRGDWEGALRAYTRVKELDPTTPTIGRDISRVYRMLKRPDDAWRAIEEVLRFMPMSPETNLEAARVLLMRGDSATARTHLDRAAEVLKGADSEYAPAVEVRRLREGNG
jgi:tetratricopeptide (TPR) repeat protein